MRARAPVPATETRRAARTAGFTLIEIMMVVLIAGLLGSSALVGFSATRRGRVRSGAAIVASAMRFAYVHALTTGRATRLVFTLGDNRVWLEDTEDAHVLDPHDPMRAGGAAVDAEEVEVIARREAEAMSAMRPRAPRAEFARPEGRRYRVRELEGVTLTRLYTLHDSAPKDHGNGYIYFFTGGSAEPAVVHLRGAGDEVFSVVLHGATGRAEVIDHAVELPMPDENVSDERDVDLREQVLREPEP